MQQKLAEINLKELCNKIFKQSVGPLTAVYTYPPLADMFIPTPTRLLLEAF